MQAKQKSLEAIALNNLEKPILLAGPCSAESKEQLLQVATSLQNSSTINMLRAGIWKPRTRPNSFEGVGEEGLKWLSEIQSELNLPVVTEVATAQHAQKALEHGIKNVWIGARTTVNPFSVQEIVEALTGEDVCVLVKNPIHADIDLWQGSIERFMKAGITNLAGVHRGFSSFLNSEYRNLPMWNIPIELQRRFPELPIICDPSHIAGVNNLVPTVAQKALDLNMAGLMIEVHPNPKEALSDPEQQLTPKDYNELIATLVIRDAKPESQLIINQLEELRAQIDKVDEDLISTLLSRMDVIRQIGQYKHNNNVSVLQLERWNEILTSRSELGSKLNMDDKFIKRLFELIHQESIRIQTNINSTK
ncbi:MAG: 3-deoxy-7-phosphoheptulonate synthase [Crocinitomicaceae bacterium]|nr:3-deoxy-7-phosphoheptulonate synthase [Crocinitomicaceae bacterium]